MHIGYFTHSPIALSETFTHDLILDLRERGADLRVFSGARSGHEVAGVDMAYTGYYEAPERASFWLYKLGQAAGFGDRLKTGFASRAAHRRLRPYRSAFANLDVAFVDYGISGALLFEALRAADIPYIIHVHGYDVSSAMASAGYRRRMVAACNAAHAIVAPSHHLRRLLILAGVAPDHIHVVRYGVRKDYVSPMRWEDRRKEGPSVVHLGRLTEKKHPLALVHAFALVREDVPEARLSIIGDGPLRHEVIARIEALGLGDAVTLHGALSRDVAFPIVNRHWIFAQHSVTSRIGDQEGFPISPAEAAMHGLPIVTTAHSGLTENVVDGVTGFLVQEHDFEAMADRIVFLLRHPEQAAQMGEAGRLRMQQLCDPSERAAHIHGLLHEAADSRHAPARAHADGPQLALSDA